MIYKLFSMIFLLAVAISPLGANEPKPVFTPLQLTEQQYGGVMVTFPEVLDYVKKTAASYGMELCIFDDWRVLAWKFSKNELALTRGFLYDIKNEEELKKLFQSAAELEGVQELALQQIPEGKSSKEFTAAFTPFAKTRAAFLALSEGFKECERGHFEEALCLAERVLGDLPEEPHHLRLLATASVGIGNCPGALIELKKALRLNPNYHGYYLQRGLLFEKLGLMDGAKIDFRETLLLYPSEEAYYHLGMIAIKEQRYEDATHFFAQIPFLQMTPISV